MLQGAAGLQYQSKLDDFDAFVAHSKLSVLPFARPAPPQPLQQLAPSAQAGAAGGSQPPTQQPRSEDGSQRGAAGAVITPAAAGKLLLLDDLPYVGDAERRQRLTAALRDLCVTCRCPVVLITTETSGGGGGARGGYGGGYGGGFGGGGDGGAMGAMGGYSKGLHKVGIGIQRRCVPCAEGRSSGQDRGPAMCKPACVSRLTAGAIGGIVAAWSGARWAASRAVGCL
jgi:hypothetical protein